MQAVGPGHEMPLRYVPVAPFGCGPVANDHLLPFQRATKGTLGEVAVERALPTATQLFALGHDTATSELAIACAVNGAVTTFQPPPVQRSINGRITPVSVTRLPTAKQVIGFVPDDGAHETASK